MSPECHSEEPAHAGNEESGSAAACVPAAPEQTGTGVPPTLAADVPCSACGYNLRGLAGDAIRCPECGTLNLDVIDQPAARAVVKEMHRIIGLIGLNFWTGAIGLTLLAALIAAVRESSLRGMECVGALELISIALFGSSFVSYRRTCGRRSGWVHSLLIGYAFSAIRGGVLIGLVIGVVAGILSPLFLEPRVRVGSLGSVLLALVAALAVGALGFLLVHTLDRLRERVLEPRLREAARTAARQAYLERYPHIEG